MLEKLKRLREKLRPRKQWQVVWIRRLLTVAVSAGILSFYFNRVDWHELGHAFARANLWIFIPARLLQVVFYLFLDVYLLQRLLVWFHGPIKYSRVLYGRSALYILSLINTQLANGGMFLYLMREAKILARKLLGLVIFRFTWSVWALNAGVTLALIATVAFRLPYHSSIPLKTIAIAVAFFWGTLVFAFSVVYYFARYRPNAQHGLTWGVFFQAKPGHCLTVGSLTLLSAVGGLVSNYYCARSFGLRIPLHEMVLLLPFADLISTLPIAFMSLGTTTFAWQTMWRSYGTTEEFLSFTLALPVATYCMRALIALVALPRASREMQGLISLVRNSPEESLVEDPGPQEK